MYRRNDNNGTQEDKKAQTTVYTVVWDLGKFFKNISLFILFTDDVLHV
jgi:hypothetical protein